MVDGEKCRKCIYYGGQTESCDYSLIMKKSRTGGIKTDTCDKFVEGKRVDETHKYMDMVVAYTFRTSDISDEKWKERKATGDYLNYMNDDKARRTRRNRS